MRSTLDIQKQPIADKPQPSILRTNSNSSLQIGDEVSVLTAMEYLAIDEAEIGGVEIDIDVKEYLSKEAELEEKQILKEKLRKKKFGPDDFDCLKVLGKGAYGKVCDCSTF